MEEKSGFWGWVAATVAVVVGVFGYAQGWFGGKKSSSGAVYSGGNSSSANASSTDNNNHENTEEDKNKPLKSAVIKFEENAPQTLYIDKDGSINTKLESADSLRVDGVLRKNWYGKMFFDITDFAVVDAEGKTAQPYINFSAETGRKPVFEISYMDEKIVDESSKNRVDGIKIDPNTHQNKRIIEYLHKDWEGKATEQDLKKAFSKVDAVKSATSELVESAEKKVVNTWNGVVDLKDEAGKQISAIDTNALKCKTKNIFVDDVEGCPAPASTPQGKTANSTNITGTK